MEPTEVEHPWNIWNSTEKEQYAFALRKLFTLFYSPTVNRNSKLIVPIGVVKVSKDS